MIRRWTLSGIVIAGLFLAIWHGKRVTYVDSSGYHFQSRVVIVGIEIPTRQWSVPRMGGPDPAPEVPWIKHTRRPLLGMFLKSAGHYEAGEKIVRERQEAEWRALEDRSQ